MPKTDVHHVSFYFDKSRIMFSVPSTTTLATLKETFLSALPQLTSSPAETPALPGLDPEEIAAMDLPVASSSNPTPSYLSKIQTTSDLCLWQPRRNTDRPIEDHNPVSAGWSSLEGEIVDTDWNGEDDKDGERGQMLKRMIKDMEQPVWERWVDLFVSFKDEDGNFSEPSATLPTVEDDEEEESEVQVVEPVDPIPARKAIDGTVLSSPFFRHDVIDNLIDQTALSNYQQTLPLLASKIRLYEDNIAEPGSDKSKIMRQLLQSCLAYAKTLLADGQTGKAESEALRLVDRCKGVVRQTTQEYDRTTIDTAKTVQYLSLDILEEVDNSLGKVARAKRWKDQKARLTA